MAEKQPKYSLWDRGTAILAGSALVAAGIAGCSTGKKGEAAPGDEVSVQVVVPEDEASAEKSQTSEVYKMPDTRVPYQKVIDDWVSQDEKVIEEIGESTSQEDLEKKAEVTAALYLKYSQEESREVFTKNMVDITPIGTEWNLNNPLFGMDPRTVTDNQLDAMLGAQELFPTMEFLERVRSGDPEGSRLIQSKVLNTLVGVGAKWGGALGFAGAAVRADLLHAEDSPERPETVTERLSGAEAEAILRDKKLYAPPSTTFWVKTTPKGENPDSIMLMRGVAVVELDEARGHKIPDFNGNTFSYEFAEPGTPISYGHPESRFAIPVITAEYQVGLVK